MKKVQAHRAARKPLRCVLRLLGNLCKYPVSGLIGQQKFQRVCRGYTTGHSVCAGCMVGNRLAAQAARTVMPSKSSKEVRQDGKDYVASYVDVDASNVTTELRPGAAGQYVGFVRYQERVMECRGKNKQEAITTASCQQVKARNINELIRYDGSTWQY